jgi:hypothetical protein
VRTPCPRRIEKPPGELGMAERLKPARPRQCGLCNRGFGPTLLFALVVEGVEYGEKLLSVRGVWFDLLQSIHHLCVVRTNLLFEGLRLCDERIHCFGIVFLLGFLHLLLELA